MIKEKVQSFPQVHPHQPFVSSVNYVALGQERLKASGAARPKREGEAHRSMLPDSWPDEI
jgi:hypothetical protein